MWCEVCASSRFIFIFEAVFENCQLLLYRKLAHPKKIVEFTQKSICAIRCCLATSYDNVQRCATSRNVAQCHLIIFETNTYGQMYKAACWSLGLSLSLAQLSPSLFCILPCYSYQSHALLREQLFRKLVRMFVNMCGMINMEEDVC